MEDQNLLKESKNHPAIKQTDKNPPGPMERYLLLGVLILGLIFQSIFFAEKFEIYACFWIAYIIVFHIFCYDKARKSLWAAPFAAFAFCLCIAFILQENGYSDDQLQAINILAIPALLMLHAQAVTHPLPRQKELAYAELYFYGFFAQPFIHIGRFFKAISSLFKGSEKNRMIWIGLLIALPIVCIVLGLLASADAVIKALVSGFYANAKLWEIFARTILALVTAILFYSFIYGAAFNNGKHIALKQYKKISPIPPFIVMGALIFIYALFTWVQFVYLFGRQGLPEGLTYSKYAADGFNQLIVVAIINLSVFGCTISRAKNSNKLNIIMTVLLAFTFIILASAFTRLGLYIKAYNLTFKRIQALWMLIYITLSLVLCVVRIYKTKLPLIRLCAYIFAGWYVILNIIDLNLLYALQF